MEDNIRRTLEEINESAFAISACAESLEYIQKDLEDLEIQANYVCENRFIGMTNIVEQLSRVIRIESERIIALVESS